MSKQISAALCCLIAVLPARAACAQATPPSTDIYLVELRLVNGAPRLGTPVNITNRPGYDNQPSFTPDSKAILFTSVRADAQADIYRYDLASKTTTRITSTPESEYSATVFGDGTRFSAIRVEADSTQRLWSFRLDGTDPRVLFPAIKPVGYHAWVDSTTVAMFLLGRPNALVLADIRGGAADTVARDVGRSLQPLSNWGGFSYVQRMIDSSWTLMAVDVRGSGRDRRTVAMPLVRMPPEADYVVWLQTAEAITATGSKLLLWRASDSSGKWQPIADFAQFGLHHVSRLALSPDHKWMAVVAE
ncbi:MAG: TolB family protein [Gemmatimonadaceae bacterium]